MSDPNWNFPDTPQTITDAIQQPSLDQPPIQDGTQQMAMPGIADAGVTAATKGTTTVPVIPPQTRTQSSNQAVTKEDILNGDEDVLFKATGVQRPQPVKFDRGWMLREITLKDRQLAHQMEVQMNGAASTQAIIRAANKFQLTPDEISQLAFEHNVQDNPRLQNFVSSKVFKPYDSNAGQPQQPVSQQPDAASPNAVSTAQPSPSAGESQPVETQAPKTVPTALSSGVNNQKSTNPFGTTGADGKFQLDPKFQPLALSVVSFAKTHPEDSQAAKVSQAMFSAFNGDTKPLYSVLGGDATKIKPWLGMLKNHINGGTAPSAEEYDSILPKETTAPSNEGGQAPQDMNLKILQNRKDQLVRALYNGNLAPTLQQRFAKELGDVNEQMKYYVTPKTDYTPQKLAIEQEKADTQKYKTTHPSAAKGSGTGGAMRELPMQFQKTLQGNKDFNTQNSKMMNAIHAKTIVMQSTDPKTGDINLNQMMTPELAMTLANIVSGSNAHTQEEFRSMNPQTLSATIKTMASNISGTPLPTEPQGFAHAISEMLQRQGETSEDARNQDIEQLYQTVVVPSKTMNESGKAQIKAGLSKLPSFKNWKYQTGNAQQPTATAKTAQTGATKQITVNGVSITVVKQADGKWHRQ